jgi:hypothetical protein
MIERIGDAGFKGSEVEGFRVARLKNEVLRFQINLSPLTQNL